MPSLTKGGFFFVKRLANLIMAHDAAKFASIPLKFKFLIHFGTSLWPVALGWQAVYLEANSQAILETAFQQAPFTNAIANHISLDRIYVMWLINEIVTIKIKEFYQTERIIIDIETDFQKRKEHFLPFSDIWMYIL